MIDNTGTILGSLDHARGSGFDDVFDLGDDWSHRCVLLATDLDPVEEYGVPPEGPVAGSNRLEPATTLDVSCPLVRI